MDAESPAFAPSRRGVRGRLADLLVGGEGVRRVGRLALAAVLLVAASTAGYLLLAAADDARTDTGARQPAGVSTTAPRGISSEHEDLLAHVSGELQDVCAPTTDPADSLGGVATVRCELPAGEPADVLWYERFATRQALETVVTATYREHGLARDDCGPEVPRAQGNWQVGSQYSGHLLCYTDDGATWVVWTYDVDRILARAVRSGDAPEDWESLYTWWREVSLFLR